MKLKNLTKSVSIIFMLLAMLFSCDQLTDEITNNSGNNTTQDGGNNNSGDNNSGNENGNENGGNSNNEKPAEKITITFDLNGIDETLPTAIETTASKSVYLPVLTNAKFLHWNTKADGSGQSYNIIATFAESVTLYAILLAENAYKITYVLDGGINNSANPFSFTEDEDIVLKEPTKDGYYFLGWYEDNNNMYIDSLKAWNAGEKSSNVTLYAKWVKSYKITYVLNGGVNSSYNPSFFTENDDRVYLGKPTKDGYFFCGWYETADFTGSCISYFYTSTNLRNITLYAKWVGENYVGTYTAGTGVYELKAPKSKIGSTFNSWGGFGVLLLKEDQLTKLETTKEGKIQFDPRAVGTFDNPTAHLAWVWNILEFPKYASAIGNAEVKSGEKVVNSAWATLDEENFTFYVDMSKILCEDSAVEVKVFADGNEIAGDKWLKSGRNLDLTGYKPYVIALFDGEEDVADNKYVAYCSWGTGIWEMKTSTATKPSSFKTFLDEADVSAIDLTTTKQAGATFQLKDASFANASNLAMVFKNGVATADFVVEEGEVDTWGRGFFAVWFQFWAGDDNELAKTGKQYYVEGAKDTYCDVFTTLGEPLNLTSDSSRGGNLAVTDLTEAGTYVITVNATGDIPTITVTKK